ncbi:MAG: NACHT domain-containing protein [Cyanothece sp. SIO1E1]|nr:NACHT domain-containing protein [Cyanothece sp. SIO1E1]
MDENHSHNENCCNNLAPIPEFPKRNYLLWRLAISITLLLLAIEIEEADVLSICRKMVIIGVSITAVMALKDAWNLYAAWKKYAQVTTAEYDAHALRKRLLEDFSLQVSKRLQDSLSQGNINLVMSQQPDKIGLLTQPGQIILEEMPTNSLAQKSAQAFQALGSRVLRILGPEEELALKPQETILRVFDRREIGGRLLILGEPGMGKTTTLLKLAEALIKRADNTNKLPYIFELSTWESTQQRAEEWLAEQLSLTYSIPTKVTQAWIDNRVLLPLLDGLDELGSKQGQAMIRLNDFIRRRSLQVVVCCRTGEYDQAVKTNKKLRQLSSLGGALCLCPLNDQQIQQYFEDRGKAKLWQQLQHNDSFRRLLKRSSDSETGLLRRPLFLKILTEVNLVEQINSRDDLFDSYITGCLKRG